MQILVCFEQILGIVYGRKDLGEYWKSIMKDQPMPEAIKGFIHQDPESFSAKGRKMNHFVRNLMPGLMVLYIMAMLRSRKRRSLS